MTPPVVRLVGSPWEDTFVELVASARADLLILSPYITRRPMQTIQSALARRQRHGALRLRLVTDVSPASLANGSLDIRAIAGAASQLPQTSLTHLPRLHAKIYVADNSCAVVTSANLTDGGLCSNYEFGVRLDDGPVVRRVREEAEGYAGLGGEVLPNDLADLEVVARELQALQKRADKGASTRLNRAFHESLGRAQLKLLQIRARGKTTHGIFADTLLYLLRRQPRRTVDLHRVIQQIHPDLCDDSVDRIIGEVHFGKKWKHYVRTAQQHLRRRGLIFHERGMWYALEGRRDQS